MNIEECLKKLNLILDSKPLDQYSTNSLNAIIQRLNCLESDNEYLNQELKGYISRIVVEMDPAILRPELSGQLIKLEKSYYNA